MYRSRRGLLAFLAGFVALRIVPVRAQTQDCVIGHVNGLLTVAGDNCAMLNPPLLGGAQIEAPSHLAGEIIADETADTAATDATTLEQERTEKLQAKRDKKHDKRGRRTNQKHDQRARRRNRDQDKRERKNDALITCEDFSSQEDANNWLKQFSEDAAILDPDNDGIACEHLPLT